MLKKDNYILILLILLFGCYNPKGSVFRKKSIEIISESEYLKILQLAQDTISSRRAAGLDYYIEEKGKNQYILDSLLCFNSQKDRFISCILARTLKNGASMDGIGFFYGEKIGSNWYFFTGPSIVIPRSLVKGHNPQIALSFNDLHTLALREIYSDYLTATGQINEGWFIEHFENVGMCAECKTREDFQKNIIAGVAAQWANRDTTQPMKRLKEKLP